MLDTTRPDSDYASARARAAQQGVQLYRQEDEFDGYVFIAVRGMATRHFPTLAEFLEWLGRVEARG